MRLQFTEHPGPLAPAVAQNPRHRQGRVVVEDAAWHAAEVPKRCVVPLAKRFRRLGRESFYESVIAMRQIDHQVVRLALYAVNDHQSFTEVGLGIARRMHQRHEHLLPAELLVANIVLDDRVTAGEIVLVAQAVEDAFCGVALFLRTFLIVDEDLIDDSGEGIQLRPLRWLAPPIARRSGVAQHLAHRPSRQAKPFGGLALTEPFDKDTAPYLSV